MTRKFPTLSALASGAAITLALTAAVTFGTAQTAAPHLSFLIATGSSGGTYFPIGQAIAAIISHPPGVARCDVPGVCGPAGLVASVRTSPGAIANVLDVNDGRADAAMAQSDIVAEAAAGTGGFREAGAQSHVRMIADLFPEDVHVVAAAGAHIAGIADLKGKRVSLGARQSGTADTAQTVLAAYRIAPWRIVASYDPPEIAARRLERGEIDAFFFVGGAPVVLIQGLVGRGKAALVPIDGAGRKRLLAEAHGLSGDMIRAEDYPGSAGPTETVSVRAVWIVNDSTPAGVVYGVTRALFDPANRQTLDDAHPSARFIRLQSATEILPVPLHPGALRFYRETGAHPGSAATARLKPRG